jgi:hypothetical protein
MPSTVDALFCKSESYELHLCSQHSYCHRRHMHYTHQRPVSHPTHHGSLRYMRLKSSHCTCRICLLTRRPEGHHGSLHSLNCHQHICHMHRQQPERLPSRQRRRHSRAVARSLRLSPLCIRNVHSHVPQNLYGTTHTRSNRHDWCNLC